MVYPEDGQPSQTESEPAGVASQAAAVAARAFGWLVGYPVLALPAALVGTALGTAAAATIDAAEDENATLRDVLIQHYFPYLSERNDSQLAVILVRAEESHGYNVVMRAFRAGDGQDILVVKYGKDGAGDPCHIIHRLVVIPTVWFSRCRCQA